MPAWLAPLAIQTGASVLGYLARKKRRTPEFGGTAYGKYLDRIRKEGRYSPIAKSKILGETSRIAGNIEGQERTNIRGYLESIGAGKSISGGKLLSSPSMERLRTVSGEAGRLETQNELSKVTAGEEFARRKTESKMLRGQEEAEDKSNLYGGLAGAGMSAYGAYYQEKAAGKLGLPYGMSPEQSDIVRAKIMYSEPAIQQLPPDWEELDENQIELLSRQYKIPLDNLLYLRELYRFKSLSEGE